MHDHGCGIVDCPVHLIRLMYTLIQALSDMLPQSGQETKLSSLVGFHLLSGIWL
jgi:hypothetical protein